MFAKDGKMKDIKTPKIVDVVWHNGEFIDWKDARVHVMSHVLHYGSSIFEGIRCYSTKQGPAVFRLREHIQRFLNSAKIYRMDHPWTLDIMVRHRSTWCNAQEWSSLSPAHSVRSLDEQHPAFGVNPFRTRSLYIGRGLGDLGDEAIEQGVDVCVSNEPFDAEVNAAMAKSGANYITRSDQDGSALNGFAEGIALDDRGYVSEGSGENISLLWRHRITPPLSSDPAWYHSRQRHSDLSDGITIRADDSTCGTCTLPMSSSFPDAAEITPIRSVDRISVGNADGANNEKIQKCFSKSRRVSGRRRQLAPAMSRTEAGAGRKQWLHGRER